MFTALSICFPRYSTQKYVHFHYHIFIINAFLSFQVTHAISIVNTVF